MNIVDLLKKNIVMIPVVASVIVGTFTGVRYIVALTETIKKNKSAITIINDKLKRLEEKIRQLEIDFKNFLIQKSN